MAMPKEKKQTIEEKVEGQRLFGEDLQRQLADANKKIEVLEQPTEGPIQFEDVLMDSKDSKIKHVATPTDNKDAANKKYVDDNITGDQGTMIFYPDANPEVTSVDGNASSTVAEQTWAAIRNDGGAASNDDSAATTIAYLNSHATTNRWNRMLRSLFLFDTSLIPDDATITSATFSVYGENKNSGFSDNGLFGLVLVASAPASETEIVAGDYNSLGSVAFITTAIEYDDFSTTGYNHFTLDEDGLAAINKTGITKLGLMLECDFLNQEPTYEVAVAVTLDAYFADKGRPQYSPRLVVTFTYA